MSRPTLIDADGHLIESGAELERFGYRGRTGDEKVDRLLARDPAKLQSAVCPGASPWDPGTRLADMDTEGIAVSVNYPTTLLMVNQLEADLANELAAAYNSWAYEAFTTKTDGRVLTMALVNVGDGAAAATEARRAVEELGAPGVVVSPFAGHVHLDDPSLDELWGLAEEHDVPIGIHGGRFTTDPLLPSGSFRDPGRYYVMAHPFGQMTAMADLILGGVLERFPQLRVAFLEAGIGWVRWYVDRLNEASETSPGSAEHLGKEPTEYALGGNCFITCEPDEPQLQMLVRYVGEDLVVFSSDYPHFDCSFPDTESVFRDHLPDEGLFRKVTVDNPRRLYGSGIGHVV